MIDTTIDRRAAFILTVAAQIGDMGLVGVTQRW